MTVETSDRKATFLGGQTDLNFSFRTLTSNPEYIKVKNQVVLTGVETSLEYGTDFTVAVNTDGVGGTVTLTPSFSTAVNHIVYRETVPKQETDYDDYNAFPADTVETAVDRLTMVQQEQKEDLVRTLKYPIGSDDADTELPAPEANAFLGWNAAGDALENKDLPDPSTLIKASTAVAEAASNDTDYMTPLKVKQEVQKSGAVLIPLANLVPAPTTSTATILGLVYPVGSIYISVVSTNPGTLFGVGTWTAFGTGRTIVGVDGGQVEFNTVEGTGGAKTHTLLTAEMPSHTHVENVNSGVAGGQRQPEQTGLASAGSIASDAITGATGGGGAHNNLQPYINVYMWKRTA